MTIPTTKQSRYRLRLRQMGLRPVQLWLPDTRRPGFADECKRQSQVVAGDAREKSHSDWAGAAAAAVDGWQ